MALLEISVIDYEIVQLLKLYPPGRMAANVWEPLHAGGWLVSHSTPPKKGSLGGAPRRAFSLTPSAREKLVLLSKEADAWAISQVEAARSSSHFLATELLTGLETE